MCDKKREDLIKRLDAYFVEHLIMSPQKTRDLFREVRVALEQKPEIDDKYVEEKAAEAQKFYWATCKTKKDSRNFIRQILRDAKGRGKKALNYAIDIIENYQLDIENSKESIGIDLVKKRFCQGRLYEDALNYIETLRKEEEGG